MAWLKRPYEYLVYYGFLLVFGLMCLVWSLVSVPLTVLLPRQTGRRLGRRVISAGFRTYPGRHYLFPVSGFALIGKPRRA